MMKEEEEVEEKIKCTHAMDSPLSSCCTSRPSTPPHSTVDSETPVSM